MNIDELLQKEISTEIEYLGGMEPGTEEYKTTVDGMTKLMDRAIEMKKFDIEHAEKRTQIEEERKDRLVKNGISIAGIVIPSVITIWGTVLSLKYDEKGAIPSTLIGRGFINKLLPRK